MNANKTQATARMQAEYNEARKDVIYFRKAWAAATVATEQTYFLAQHDEMSARVAAIVHVARNSGITLVA